MTSSSSTKLRKLSLFQFQRQKYSFSMKPKKIFSPYIVIASCIALSSTTTESPSSNSHNRVQICFRWIRLITQPLLSSKGELGKRKRKAERGEWLEILAPAVHWFQETTSCSRQNTALLFVMNNKDKSCFFFEYNVAIFDQLEDVFITNIITCILNCYSPS